MVAEKKKEEILQRTMKSAGKEKERRGFTEEEEKEVLQRIKKRGLQRKRK